MIGGEERRCWILETRYWMHPFYLRLTYPPHHPASSIKLLASTGAEDFHSILFFYDLGSESLKWQPIHWSGLTQCSTFEGIKPYNRHEKSIYPDEHGCLNGGNELQEKFRRHC